MGRISRRHPLESTKPEVPETHTHMDTSVSLVLKGGDGEL